MQYKQYKVEDFLFDEFFVRWVKRPGPETEHFWQAWIEENPEKLHTINEARKIIESIKPKNHYDPSEEEHNAVLEKIMKPSQSWSQLGYFKKNDRLTSWVKYAAVFVIILCFGGLVVYLNANQSTDQVITVKMLEKVNPFGLKTTFELPDGTIVKLNAGSNLIYPSNFVGNERKVQLTGEAFFEVKHDETQPFIVETKDLTTTVLGTSFNIKSYSEESTSSVAVASGKVMVYKNDESEESSLLLEKDQMVTYNKVGSSLTKLEIVPEDVFAWRDNIIYFNDNDFSSVINTLTKWYGVEFVIKNNKTYSGKVRLLKYNNPKLEIVLQGLKDHGQFGFNFEFSDDGKTVFIN